MGNYLTGSLFNRNSDISRKRRNSSDDCEDHEAKRYD